MKLDHASSKPLHVQAEEILRKLIESEEYKNGKFLPNEVDLSERLNIRAIHSDKLSINWYLKVC